MQHSLNLKQIPKKSYISGVPLWVNDFIFSKIIKDNSKANYLYITCNDVTLEQSYKALSKMVSGFELIKFPAWDCQAYDRVSPNSGVQSARLKALYNISTSSKPKIIITSYHALLNRVMPAETLKSVSFEISKGEILSQDDLIRQLVRAGYKNSNSVTEAGEFSRKGSILDVYLPSYDKPLRIDFFGDKIDLIKYFDPLTQISTGKVIKAITVIPALEVILNEANINNFSTNFTKYFSYDDTQATVYQDTINNVLSPVALHLMPLFYEKMVTLFDYLPRSLNVVIGSSAEDSLSERLDTINDYYKTRKINYDKLKVRVKDYLPIPPELLYLNAAEITEHLANYNNLIFDIKAQGNFHYDITSSIDCYKSSLVQKKHTIDILKAYLDDHTRDHKNLIIVICAYSQHSLEQLQTILREHDLVSVIVEAWPDKPIGPISLLHYPLEKGFNYQNYIVISEQDLLGSKVNRTVSNKRRAERLILEAGSIEEGEIVVHKEHGVAEFLGLKKLNIQDLEHDFLCLSYLGNDKLYVPVWNMDMISRYGQSATNMRLDKLGSGYWSEKKSKVKKKLKDIAGDLLEIASARELQKGQSYYSHDFLKAEFDAKFEFTETKDQERAIEDVTKDLSSGRNMDRLICGDVGFGKTEVAMRAAFSVVTNDMNDKVQVAIVVPTTLLSRQHYNNFLKRFEGFDINIAQLSRMVTTAGKKKVIEGLESGQVQIVIGTHSLLNDKIKFKNLALIIVDEEQHFGVSQKEKLKKLKKDLHILTLTATPIPRTLQMSLNGIRDLSLLATPPVDRMAVRTFIMPFDGMIIREAILREFYRSGRVFYVCPKIRDLEKTYDKISKLVPEIKIVMAHGKMSPAELDQIMIDFYEGKYQLLLSTTIIESGIDIASANTIIIHNAHHFGLSALYQLRGRVGRSKTRAYAYLLFDEKVKLNTNAEKRLEVMQTLDGLGAGFNLASYDLDIRGAGNLLGEAQSGHIKDIGVELYQQMLEEAITALKNSHIAKDNEDSKELEANSDYTPKINIGASVFIPERYISDESVRIEFYRRIAFCKDTAEAEEIELEMIDRFGDITGEIKNLFAIVSLKQFCYRLNINRIEAGPKAILFGFRADQFHNPEKLIAYINYNPLILKLRPDQKLVLKYADDNPTRRIERITKFLNDLLKL
ncbi:MAG: transcription-repair coupling factor [Rickettsiales bacterium]|jgi:transcription-repair coupling factor (superfamily II helicase)|nr:transcription-repair coupling factor [Rickettsiales bacterium]